MSLISRASNASCWRGYEYYLQKHVESLEKVAENVYICKVKGSNNNVYDVRIDIDKTSQSRCNCPHADGRRVICKHMVAAFFTAFPEEAKKYICEVEEYEAEEEGRREDRYSEIKEYVYSLSKNELRIMLLDYMTEEEFSDDY